MTGWTKREAPSYSGSRDLRHGRANFRYRSSLPTSVSGGFKRSGAQSADNAYPESRLLFLEQMGSDFPVDQYGREVTDHFTVLATTQLRLKPGVVELLEVLDQLKLPRCIATSSSHSTVQSHLSAHGLAGRFDAVIAHGDYAASKPSPDPFLTAAKRFSVEPALCLALKDSFNGVRSASAAGMMIFMVPDLLSPTPEIHSLCTGVVSDLHAVRKLILTASAAGTIE
ncbi:HAD superfamily hydrolase (TIGR01509 family) [Rhizobium beringeri]